MHMRTTMILAASGLVVALTSGCSAGPQHSPTARKPLTETIKDRIAEDLSSGLPARRDVAPSSAFWKHWKDGRAELTSYRISTPRYGELREGHFVLVTVAQEMDRRTWLKNETSGLPGEQRVPVLKQNQMLKFRTGIYPYSVMTSVFAATIATGRERFAPGKISFSAQEWCGHVYQSIYPKGTHYYSLVHSYFSSEGDRVERVDARRALYEDALLIQLRGLDGSFNGGEDWQGQLVPTLWSSRKRHQPLQPVQATIRRQHAVRDGRAVQRFVLSYSDRSKQIDIDEAFPHHVVGWESSDGEKATLVRSKRLTYWRMNNHTEASYLTTLGLECADTSAC